MFNFHKPRTYRSAEGCCICKAKSSSSRFTDSRKYERDTMQCFDLKYPRQGEICNACVLLVKRYKRLPVGSKRNWSHIVDAKAGLGPGYNKIQTKYKSERINSRAAAAAQQQQQQNGTSTNSNSTHNGANANSSSGMSYIPEKFSKIFKKTKKIKDSSSTSSSSHSSSKRKTSNNGWSQSGNTTQSLPTTPDSLDSDYEDSRLQTQLNGANQNQGTIVQFQTQTRASAYKAQAALEARRRLIKLGTKRRKCMMPRKHYRSLASDETLKFFDEQEWQERKSCCGMFYECAALGGALLIDMANYKPCEEHQKQNVRLMGQTEETVKRTTTTNNEKQQQSQMTNQTLQKSIIQTMPAVVQLQPPPQTPVSNSTAANSNSNTTVYNNSFKTATTTTPVLKKHHLFFKRQSECFPQGDMVTTLSQSNNNNDQNTTATAHVVNIKTESEFNVPQQQHQHQQLQQSGTITLQRHNENAIHSSSSSAPSTAANNTIITTTSSALSISVTSAPSSSSSASTTMPQMPKHSLAKVTTISPPLNTTHHQSQQQQHYHANTTNLPLAKPNSFLHKIKADNGKIVKHSLEKFNTAVRLKSSDLHEMKPIIRTVDKSYILAKPPTQANIITLNTSSNNNTSATYQSLASYNAAGQQPLTTASLSAASPTSSTSSTSSTKFSDNSSDSGFDENMLDRKSASPLQEDCDKKILSRPGVQTMFLASGVQIQGQPQNLVLTGNEVAAKILQNRKYSSITSTPISSNSRSLSSNHHPTTTAVKIAQISTNPHANLSTNNTNGSSISMSSAAQAKMRAIYNNNNTIQHENGITTIVPASSLAASTQTAAMQNIAPSTVTITPAPPLGTQFNTQNVISRKLTTANIINLQSNTTTNLSNSSSVSSSSSLHHNNHHHQQHHLGGSSSSSNSNNNTTTNQKIILLKTSPNNTTTLTATSAGNYTSNSLTGVGGQHLTGGSSGGGR